MNRTGERKEWLDCHTEALHRRRSFDLDRLVAIGHVNRDLTAWAKSNGEVVPGGVVRGAILNVSGA